MNSPETLPPIEAVLKARELAERASGVAADNGALFSLDTTAAHFAEEIQALAPHFPQNNWLREKAARLPSLPPERITRSVFDELTLGCQEIYHQFKHLLDREDNTPRIEAAAA